MAKEMRCGDLMPGCSRVIEGKDEKEVVAKATEHTRNDHNIRTMTPDLEQKVRNAIQKAASISGLRSFCRENTNRRAEPWGTVPDYNPRVEVRMRSVVIVLALIVVSGALFAQQPVAPSAPNLFVSAADLSAMIARAKSERKADQANFAQPLLRLAPITANLEYRVAAPQAAAVHEKEAEIFYVIDGVATLVTGGKLKDDRRTNAENLTGTAVDGGASRRIAKGDFILVPENTPHWFTDIDGSLTLMSLHVPHTTSTTR